MKRARLRIFDLMGLVTLAALNCLPFRYLRRQDWPVTFRISALAFTPMASLLAIVLVLMARGIRRRGEARPFLSGFLGFGLIAMAAAALPMGSEDRIYAYFELVGRLIVRMLAPLGSPQLRIQSPRWEWVVDAILIVLSLDLPMVLVALAGGWLAKWAGLTISRSRSSGPARDESALVR